jgi:hypothetical protein
MSKLLLHFIILIVFISCKSSNISCDELDSKGQYIFLKNNKFTGCCESRSGVDKKVLRLEYYKDGLFISDTSYYSDGELMWIRHSNYFYSEEFEKYGIDTLGIFLTTMADYKDVSKTVQADINFWIKNEIPYSYQIDTFINNFYYNNYFIGGVDYLNIVVLFTDSQEIYNMEDWKAKDCLLKIVDYVKLKSSPKTKKLSDNDFYNISFDKIIFKNDREYLRYNVDLIDLDKNDNIANSKHYTYIFFDFATKEILEWDDATKSFVNYLNEK